MNPVTNFADYDSIILGGVRSPGVVTFPQAPKRIEGWEQQVPSGGGGGFTVHKKSPPIEFDVEIYVWVGEDEFGAAVDGFADYEEFSKMFQVAVKPLPIATPQTGPASAEVSGGADFTSKLGSSTQATSPQRTVKALAFSHPLTDKLRPPVASVVIGSYSMPKPDGIGGGTATIHFEEYRPLKILPITGPDGTFTKKADPNADVKAKLAAKQATLDSVRNAGQ